ncbi:hypothetical protein HYS79_00720 [Patescibacteria group bacterium]|nr:hypothetical protein [Patescibacteria group bacterium]
MPLAYNIKKNILRMGAKTLLTGIMVVLAFSPLVQSISLTQAIEPADPQTVNTAGKADPLSTTPNTTATANPAAQESNKAAKTDFGTEDNSGCLNFSGNNWFAFCISNIVYYVMVGLFGSFAYIAAYFFSFAVQLSLDSTAYALSFLNTSWETTRDLANMAFIFILIYIAFTVMLKAETGGTMKMLAGVIVVALVINFSFFLTRVVIDGGNVLAIQFYNLIEYHPIGVSNSTNTLPGPNVVTSFAGGQYKDLTYSIMSAVRIDNIFNTPSFQLYNKSEAGSGVNGFLYTVITLSLVYVAVGIMFALLAGSFLFAGAKFVMRVVGLWIVIIAAPLALIGRALNVPATKKLYDQWLEALVKYSFYPAIYLFLFFILTTFMKEMAQSGNLVNGIWAAGQTPNNESFVATVGVAIASVAIRMGFVIAMMYVALSGADMIVKAGSGWARSFQGKVFGAGLGAVAGLGRLTFGTAVGGGLRRLGSASTATDGVVTRLSRAGAAGVGSFLQNRTYDVRAVPGVTKIPEVAAGAAYAKYGSLPLDLGAPSTVHAVAKGRAPSPRDKERIRNLSKNQLGQMDYKQLNGVIEHVSEKQMAAIKELDKISDKQKENLEKVWHEQSGDAPRQQTQKIVRELQKVREELKARGVSLEKLSAHTAERALINSASVKEMIVEINDKVAAENFKSRDTDLSKKDRVIAGQNAARLQEVKNSLNKLADETKKIPSAVSDTKTAGEYRVKVEMKNTPNPATPVRTEII